jgi:hypothetical protein
VNIKLLLKDKRILSVIFVVVFFAVIFSLKTKSEFKNEANQMNGLTYRGTETIEELTNKDTDLDGVLDWEESLWGTDPTKKDTNGDGVSDGVEVAKVKENSDSSLAYGQLEEENLTETEKFSRELFSTVVTLNQTGGLDQETVDILSTNLAEQIKNPTLRKVFSYSDIKTTNDNSVLATQNYSNSLDTVFKKYPTLFINGYEGIVIPIGIAFATVFQTFLENGEDPNILTRLDPTVKDLQGIINGMAKMTVPNGLLVLHLEAINALERITENLSDLKLIENDTILAMGAANKFAENIDLLESSINKLQTSIRQKLNY